MNLPKSTTSNPIYERERLHQRRSASTGWKRREPIIVSVLIVILFIGGATIYPGRNPFPIFAMLWGFHLIAVIRMIGAGLDIISREYQQGTWEPLILTGISSRRIFFGKWRAVLSSVWGWGVALAALWTGFSVIVFFQFGSESGAPWFRIFTIPILAGVFSALEVICCVSLSIGASALTRRRNLAALLAGTLRIVPSLFCGILSMTFLMGNSFSDESFIYSMFGLSEPSLLIISLGVTRLRMWLDYLPGLVLGFFLLLILTVIALITGLASIRHVES